MKDSSSGSFVKIINLEHQYPPPKVETATYSINNPIAVFHVPGVWLLRAGSPCVYCKPYVRATLR